MEVNQRELIARQKGQWPLFQALDFMEVNVDRFSSNRAWNKALEAIIISVIEFSPDDFNTENEYLQAIKESCVPFMNL